MEGEKKFTRLYRVSFEKVLLKVVQQKLKYIFSYPPAFSFLSAIKLLISLLTRYNNMKHLYSTIYTELKIFNNFLLGHLYISIWYYLAVAQEQWSPSLRAHSLQQWQGLCTTSQFLEGRGGQGTSGSHLPQAKVIEDPKDTRMNNRRIQQFSIFYNSWVFLTFTR